MLPLKARPQLLSRKWEKHRILHGPRVQPSFVQVPSLRTFPGTVLSANSGSGVLLAHLGASLASPFSPTLRPISPHSPSLPSRVQDTLTPPLHSCISLPNGSPLRPHPILPDVHPAARMVLESCWVMTPPPRPPQQPPCLPQQNGIQNPRYRPDRHPLPQPP